MTTASLPRGCRAMLGGRPSGRIAIVENNHALACDIAEREGCAVALAAPGELLTLAKRLRAAWPCLTLELVCQPGQNREAIHRAAEAVGGVVVRVGPGDALKTLQARASSLAGAAA